MQEKTKDETLKFKDFTQYKIKGVVYDVTSHFDENGEELIPKLKRLLKSGTKEVFALDRKV